jgi:hypothetical protein
LDPGSSSKIVLSSYLDDSTFVSQNEVLRNVMPFSGACWYENRTCLSGVTSKGDEVGEAGDIYALADMNGPCILNSLA